MAAGDTCDGGIVLSGLCKSYGDVHAVRSIDLAIAAGETVALLGPNGAGKTTTTDMMVGLTRPDRGRCLCSAGRRQRPCGRAGSAACCRPDCRPICCACVSWWR
ncbi:MAG: ATP-binding cassette domain-containing protein [Solirubrobacteraceae bacterium]